MFGSKFRSWMDAVRPRKKQHRKEKPSKSTGNNIISSSAYSSENWQNSSSCRSLENEIPTNLPDNGNKCQPKALKTPTNQSSNHAPPTSSRYSANNLSSPESAYSTGYSTDGTSPVAPPDYYINVRTGTRYFSADREQFNNHNQQLEYVQHKCLRNNETDKILLQSKHLSPLAHCVSSPRMRPVTVHQQNNRNSPINNVTQTQQEVEIKIRTPTTAATSRTITSTTYQPISSNNIAAVAMPPTSRLTDVIGSPNLTSPRQRNRIRTNPWVPTNTPISPISQIREDLHKAAALKDCSLSRPFSSRLVSSASTHHNPTTQICSLSSSSCSSLSGASVHLEVKRPGSGDSDEDDCTLNEMMGKYDESYVYEKETDILSDSDPTDCDTDIDTGQDGGDEDDREFDFIDNGSYLELDPREDHNTGHCVYYNFEINNKRTSRRRTTQRRNKQPSVRRRRSSSNKKRHKPSQNPHELLVLDGSKSAGATPLSVRRTLKHHPIISKLALDDCLVLKKRSNSVSFSGDRITSIDKRDKEADRKYKELIVEAEHILRNMKSNGLPLSPRRVPGPANKRVEILRSAECAKPELFLKNRLNTTSDELSTQFSKLPSNNFNCPRFSPKKNHITNFINSNSPVLLRRDNELPTSALVVRKKSDEISHSPSRKLETNIRRSPKYRRKINRPKLTECNPSSSSSDSDKEQELTKNINNRSNEGNYYSYSCPQSEPVRRKIYSKYGKTVAFNLNCETRFNDRNEVAEGFSSENIRQQALLNTITNLKRSLEDQSASLKQVYRSSQNIKI